MDPGKPDIQISDVVISTTGRDQGELFYVIDTEQPYLLLANGKDRTLDKPKRKKCKHITVKLFAIPEQIPFSVTIPKHIPEFPVFPELPLPDRAIRL